MNESLVKLDNNMVWDGAKQPFHESYYLKLSDKEGQWGFWLRYSFNTPAPGNPNGIASVSAIYSESGQAHVALRQDFDMGTFEVVHADQFIQIDKSNLSLADCTGGIVNGKDAIKWELTFEDPVVSVRHYPHALLYGTAFPPIKLVAPRMLGFVTGTLFVNHRKIRLFRDRVHQGHAYGTGFAKSWAWASCVDFREDTEAYFEGLSARMPFGRGRVSRPLGLFHVGMEGRLFQANSLLKMVFQNRSRYDAGSWNATFEKSGFRFDCEIRRRPEDVVGVTTDGPAGEHLYSYASLLADIEIKVQKRRRGAWQDYKLLTATGKCLFETASDERHSEIPVLL